MDSTTMKSDFEGFWQRLTEYFADKEVRDLKMSNPPSEAKPACGFTLIERSFVLSASYYFVEESLDIDLVVLPSRTFGVTKSYTDFSPESALQVMLEITGAVLGGGINGADSRGDNQD